MLFVLFSAQLEAAARCFGWGPVLRISITAPSDPLDGTDPVKADSTYVGGLLFIFFCKADNGFKPSGTGACNRFFGGAGECG